MRMTNKELYEKYYDRHVAEGGKFPGASALGALVEYCIRKKKYTIYYDVKRDENNMPLIDEFEIIVVFNFAGDPTFGFHRIDDSDDVIVFSTDNGMGQKYI